MIFKIILISIEPGVDHWCKHVWETSWEYYRYYSLYKVHMKLGHSVLKILIEMGDIYRSDTSRIVHQPWFLIFLTFEPLSWSATVRSRSLNIWWTFASLTFQLVNLRISQEMPYLYRNPYGTRASSLLFSDIKHQNNSQICWHIAIAGAFYFEAYLARIFVRWTLPLIFLSKFNHRHFQTLLQSTKCVFTILNQ